MLKNYFKTAWRNLVKNKFYSSINIAGLTIKYQQYCTLLAADFIKLVFFAIVIAMPIAWYAMHKWLQEFAYKVNISWWVFVLAGCIAIAIALITISLQTIKAALSNPVKSLRTE
jgi:hypothetical protein